MKVLPVFSTMFAAPGATEEEVDQAIRAARAFREFRGASFETQHQ